MPYFGNVKRFFLFVAPARSGHSVVGHLLSAHLKVLISDELGAISYFREGYSASQVYALIKHQDWRLHQRKRQKSGYDYAVEGGWQGVYDKLPEVIGDAKGTRSATIFGEEPSLIDDVRERVGVPLRMLFHLRNPYDIAATKVRRRGMTADRAATAIENQSRQIRTVFEALPEEERLVQYHEEMVAEPEDHFSRMFRFLDVEEDQEITRACAGKIWGSASRTRDTITWDRDVLARIRRVTEQDPLFCRYAGDEPDPDGKVAGSGPRHFLCDLRRRVRSLRV